MVVADLHVHTTNSDGALTLETLPAAADRAGVEVVAVTDHDRVHPDIEGSVVEIGGVTVVHGIELRVDAGDQRLDLLGYGLERTDDLLALTERLQANRIERARRIVDAVEAETGAELSVAFEPGVGRPHIARAIDESDAPYDYRGAFAELIGDDGPCFVPRDIPDFEAGRAVLADSCAVVGLAHPFRYGDPEAALERTAALDAVEIPYPYEHDVDREPARRVAEEHDLLVTGGSDAHEEELGLAGLDPEGYRRFESAL